MISFAVALQSAVEVAANAYGLYTQCESPIEVMLGSQIQALINRAGENRITLEPQFPLGRYRFDFAIKVSGRPIVLIECDGAAFHSTHAQIENDQRKSVAAWEAGLTVLRFTGSEINRNAQNCAMAALNYLISELRGQ